MSHLFKKLFHKKETATTPLVKNQPLQETKECKLTQDEIVEQWKLAAPRRKGDCIKIISQLRELIDTNDFTSKEKLSQAIQIIQGELNLYHLGIYSVQGDWLVLYAGAGEAVERMLARSVKREIKPEHGLVGHVAATQKTRFVWDVEPETQFYFQGPDLDKTKSEIALPLLLNNEMIGVIDLQSIIRCDFQTEEHAVFQTMADCVSKILAMQFM